MCRLGRTFFPGGEEWSSMLVLGLALHSTSATAKFYDKLIYWSKPWFSCVADKETPSETSWIEVNCDKRPLALQFPLLGPSPFSTLPCSLHRCSPDHQQQQKAEERFKCKTLPQLYCVPNSGVGAQLCGFNKPSRRFWCHQVWQWGPGSNLLYSHLNLAVTSPNRYFLAPQGTMFSAHSAHLVLKFLKDTHHTLNYLF